VPDRLLLAGWLLLAAAGSSAQTLEPPIDAEGRLSARWRVAGLPQQKPALTQYSTELVDGRPALRLQARASYGNLVLDAAGVAAPKRLGWAWRIDQANPAADLRSKAGDDTAARVCLAFDLPLDRVPFVERQMLRMARAQTGQPLPAATLCWVWGHGEPQQALIDNAYSRRVRYLVLRNQGDGSGRWHQESVDVAADFRRAFGDESPDLPPLVAVIVAADADNTRAQSVAHLRALSFEP
jgi:Protein of unknown function (DUF3047)